MGGGAAANASFDACTVRGGVCVGTVDPCPPCFTKRPDPLVPTEDAGVYVNQSKPIKTDDSEISATARIECARPDLGLLWIGSALLP